MRSATIAAIVTTLSLIAGPAAAQFEIDSFFTGSDAPRIDGNLEEWSTAQGEELIPFTPLDDGDRMGGDSAWEGEDDISLEFAVANNAKNLFLAFKIKDQRFVRTKKFYADEDHVELWFAVPKTGGKFSVFGLGVFADPSKYKGPVEIRTMKPGARRAGGKVNGAKGAVKGDENTYEVEVSIPWSALPKGKKGRMGIRAGLYAIDGDMAAHMSRKSILASATIEAIKNPSQMPRLLQGDVDAGLGAFRDEMDLSSDQEPRFTIKAHIAGNKKKEKIMVIDRYAVAQGKAIGGPNAYIYAKLPVKGDDQVLDIKARDLLGNRKAELIFRFREEIGVSVREWVEIYRIRNDMSFQKIFSALTLVSDGSVNIENKYRFVKGHGKLKAIEVTPGKVAGVDKDSIEGNVPDEGGNLMVFPWDSPSKLKYHFENELYQTK